MQLLGTLERVALREVWANEAAHFSPWLAQEENLKVLSTAIGLDLELESLEKDVGLFRADIVCKDALTQSYVLIENQLEPTNHSHLGQLITYAAGLNAVTVVWVAERIRDEHRSALDWLNENTNDTINFFGLEIELWRIGNSLIAPKFNIVSQPNQWKEQVVQIRNSADSSETHMKRRSFWTGLSEFLRESGNLLKSQKITTSASTAYKVGKVGFTLKLNLGLRDRNLSIQFLVTGNKAEHNFRQLESRKSEIESVIGEPLNWRQLEKYYTAELFKRDFDVANPDNWPSAYQWIDDRLRRFYDAFAPRIHGLSESPDIETILQDNSEN